MRQGYPPGSAGGKFEAAGRQDRGAGGEPGVGETLAVFGGSFDPPHLGHALAALYVLSAYPVHRMLVIPAFRHPFAKPLASFEHRATMCELAMADVKRVEISRIEQQLGGDSLTLRTLQELGRRMPHNRLRLVIGSDLLREIPNWHSFERIAEIAPPIVLSRGGHPAPEAVGTAPEAVGAVLPALSSSQVRQRINAGLSTEGWLCTAVARYIARHGLYRQSG